MRTHVKYVLLALVAVIATAFAAHIASAVTIRSSGGGITATSLGKLTFSGREPTITIECLVTLSGRINPDIVDTAGSRLGTVTEGRANECGANESAEPLFEGGAWELTLARATELASSPKLATINDNRVRFEVVIIGVNCKYEGQILTSLEAEGSPIITRLLSVLTNSPARIGGGGFCSRRAELRGRFSLTPYALALR